MLTLREAPSLPMTNNSDSTAGSPQPLALRAFWALLMTALFAAGLILHFTSWNKALLIWGNAESWLSPYFWMSITVLGTGWVAVLFVSMADRQSGVCSIAALGALVVGGVWVTVLKHWMSHPRPLRVLSAESIQVIGQPLSGMNSMPSGHALTAMTAVTVIILFLRWNGGATSKFTPLLLAIGVLVSWSRVVVGAHWPADVFVGAALGVATGLLCWQLGLWCRRRWGVLSPKLPIVFELMVVGYAPFEKNAYPQMQLLLWVIIALGIVSVMCRSYRLYRMSGKSVRAC